MAADGLAQLDLRFRPLIERHGYPVLRRSATRESLLDLDASVSEPFSSLVHTVTNQQLSGAVADRIFGRIVEACGGILTPKSLLGAGEPALLAAGLSRAKAASVLGLALSVSEGAISLQGLHDLDDDDVIAQITALKGFGPWSAHMHLIFYLERLNVWPSADLGVRKGVARLLERGELPTPKEMGELGEVWSPYRSLAAWYLWRLIEERT